MPNNDSSQQRTSPRQAAFELFGEMRSATPEEQEAMRKVYERHAIWRSDKSVFDILDEIPEYQSVDLGVNIFDLLPKQDIRELEKEN